MTDWENTPELEARRAALVEHAGEMTLAQFIEQYGDYADLVTATLRRFVEDKTQGFETVFREHLRAVVRSLELISSREYPVTDEQKARFVAWELDVAQAFHSRLRFENNEEDRNLAVGWIRGWDRAIQWTSDSSTKATFALATAPQYRKFGNAEAARASFQQAADWFQQSGDARSETAALTALAELYLETKSYAQARIILARPLEIYRALGDRAGEAQTLLTIGMSLRQEPLTIRTVKMAVDNLTESRRIYLELGESRLVAYLTLQLAETYGGAGKIADAVTAVEEAILLARSAGFDEVLVAALRWRATIYYDHQADYKQALAVFDEALELARRIHHAPSIARVTNSLCRRLPHLDPKRDVLPLYLEGLEASRTASFDRDESWFCDQLALLFEKNGEFERASQYYSRCIELERNFDPKKALGVALRLARMKRRMVSGGYRVYAGIGKFLDRHFIGVVIPGGGFAGRVGDWLWHIKPDWGDEVISKRGGGTT